ncbi:MAG: FtsQ-type POTRA domain-containing protein [Clostridia bacterium]|nr:FtsQ-type POTRA domain-containing protein [Clostridia bacterium]
MQIRERSKNSEREKTVEINLYSLVCISLLVIMGVLLLLLSLHFVKRFIPAKSFEIIGESTYEPIDLAKGSGIELGDRIFRIDTEAAEERLLVSCPYLESVNIKRTLFGKVKFEVECYEPVWYVEVAGDCYVLDRELRVLEETADREGLYERDLIYLTLPHLKNAIVGETVVFGNSDGEIEETQKIMDIILSSAAAEMICTADIDNRYDVHFEFDKIVIFESEEKFSYSEIDDFFTVNVGGYSKLATKLEYITKAMLKEDLAGAVGGTVDVSEEGDKVSIRPKYASVGNN